jgi:hypothetical protein
MYRTIYYFGLFIGLLLSLPTKAQVSLTGLVRESDTLLPVASANVLVKKADGKLAKFGITNGEGRFSLTLPQTEGLTLEVTMMGFKTYRYTLTGKDETLDIKLTAGALELKEVTVKADRIREQGDTLTYNVGSFAQQQDRSICDVLNRMPGIDVKKDGRIQYQGEDINKFYIEGSDLLGGRYGLATQSINHEDIGAVEVMENHQPLQVLTGISFSDKAAINLKLKEKAKAVWTAHGSLGGGYSDQPQGALWNADLFTMAVMPSYQSLNTLKTNNTGKNLSLQATDFFSTGRQTGLGSYVSVSLPGVPSLDERRTLFNRSLLFSSNSLWKVRHGEVKAQIDYSFNRTSAQAANVTTYFLNEGDRIITEDRNGKEHAHSLAGKFIYELNQKTTYINNTLQTNLDWDNLRLSLTGTLPNTQSASLPDYYVSNQLKMIRRFKGKHLITFQSRNEWESLPQTLTVEMSPTATGEGSLLRQRVGNHAFFTHESVQYAFSLSGFTVSMEGGLKGYFGSMHTQLPESTALEGLLNTEAENVLSTNYYTLYAAPKMEYWFKHVNLTLNAPISLTHYTFSQSLADRTEAYFSPSLSLNWKPNNRFNLTVRGSSGRSPMSLNLIQPGLIMTNYRSFQQGVDDFYTSTSQSLSASLAYKNTRQGLFANAFATQGWTHLPYTLSQQLLGDYVVYTYSAARSQSRNFWTHGNVGKTLDFLHGSFSVNGGYRRGRTNLRSEDEAVSSVSTLWSVGAKLGGTPVDWLSFDYALDYSDTRLALNDAKASWLGSMQHTLQVNVFPCKLFSWSVEGEYYHNEFTANRYKDVTLLDTSLLFTLSKKVELKGSLNNVLNKRTYHYTTYSQLSSFQSERRLRGRELLFTITLKK